jgi:hypothetical protein
MKNVFLTLVLFLCSFAHAEEWTDLDKKLFVASEVSLFADWLQTRQIVKQPQRYEETNPILGKHPSMSSVNAYFIGAMIGNYYLADWLGENRSIYLGTVTVVETGTVIHNKIVGLKLAF